MKYLVLTAIVVSTLFTGCEQAKKATEISAEDVVMKSYNDSISYSIGANYAKGLAENFKDELANGSINRELIVSGLNQFLNENENILSDEEQQALFKKFGEAKQKTAKAKNEKYLEDNKTKEGYKTTASGLQYKVLKEGTGATPIATDLVSVHYTGKNIGGKVFDSSVQRGEPAKFPVNGVIKGWTEALQLMKVGSKYELTIPQDLAYGPRGNQGIAPFSTLIFEVELLEIVPAPVKK